MKKLIKLSATPALVAGMAVLAPGAAQAQSLFDEMNFYVGATGGFISGEAEHHDAVGGELETDADFGIVSALVGIDTRSDDWLFGIEADIGLPVGDDLDNGDLPSIIQWSDMNYDAHVRARVGRRFGNADVFLAGGLAITELEQEDDDGNSDSHTLTGYSIGGGVDWPLTENLKARVEILHDEYGKVTTVDNYTGDWSDTTVRGGLLFQF